MDRLDCAEGISHGNEIPSQCEGGGVGEHSTIDGADAVRCLQECGEGGNEEREQADEAGRVSGGKEEDGGEGERRTGKEEKGACEGLYGMHIR